MRSAPTLAARSVRLGPRRWACRGTYTAWDQVALHVGLYSVAKGMTHRAAGHCHRSVVSSGVRSARPVAADNVRGKSKVRVVGLAQSSKARNLWNNLAAEGLGALSR